MATRRNSKQKPIALVDVVIPSYGNGGLLQPCLDSLQEASEGIDLNVIVVDDGSPNVRELRSIYAQARVGRVLYNTSNRGFPATCNRGVAAGRAKYILLLNTDVELQPGSVRAMLDEMANPGVGVVAPKLLFHPETRWGEPMTIQHAGIMVNIDGRLVHANIGWRADHPKVNARRDQLQMVSGACLMTSREEWEAVAAYYASLGDQGKGGFSEVYGRGTYEDAEYCLAVRGQGKRVVYLPTAVGLHRVGASASDTGGFELQRNDLIFKARCGHMLMWDEWRYW